MKHFTIALVAFGLTSSYLTSFAESLPEPTIFNYFSNINVPALSGGFTLGVTGYYLQPTAKNGDLDYASLNRSVTPFNSTLKNVDPSYDWGWGANIGYVFPNTGNDVNVDYFHFDSEDKNSVLADANNIIKPINLIVPSAFNFSQGAIGKAEYDLDQVDLTVGQFIDLGCRLKMHPMAGVRWASLQRKLSANYTDLPTDPTVINVTTVDKSDFSGIGPLAGLDSTFYLGDGLSLVGHFDSALLLGNIDDKFNDAFFLNSVNTANETFTVDSTRRIVPVMNMKLGAEYALLLGKGSNLTLEAGYQVTHYYHVFDRLFGSPAVLSPTNMGSITARQSTGMGLNGPYLSLTLHGFASSLFNDDDFSEVSVPSLPGGFVIGGSGYYLQPSVSHGDLDYADLSNGMAPFSSTLKSIDPGYDWGWGANVGYIFPNTGNDLNLSYFHFDTDDTSSVLANSGVVAPIGFLNIPFPQYTGSAAAKAEYDLDQVDLTAGQFINVGCRLQLHPLLGVRWADLRRKLFTSASDLVTDAVVDSQSTIDESKFNGVGPIVGVDANYALGLGFGIVGHFDPALLIGNMDEKLIANISQFAAPTTNSFNLSFNTRSKERVVPVINAKLGADYTVPFNNTNLGLALEAGYEVMHYFDAVDRLAASADPGHGGPNMVNKRSTSSIGLNGPYVSLTFHG